MVYIHPIIPVQSIAVRMEYHLNCHDSEDPTVKHQGIVIVQTATAAEQLCDNYNKFYPGKCTVYTSNAQQQGVFERFVRGEIHAMVTTSDLVGNINCWG